MNSELGNTSQCIRFNPSIAVAAMPVPMGPILSIAVATTLLMTVLATMRTKDARIR